MLDSTAAGLLTGLSLIVAIGAQNAYVLRQGLAREHVGLVVAICALSDLVLIVAGVAGIGTDRRARAVGARRGAVARRRLPDLVRRLLAAARPQARGAATRPSARRVSRRGVAVRALALTWLNPHVYLDTVLLLGSIANHEGPTGPLVVRRRARASASIAVVLRPRASAPASPARSSPARGPGRCSTC